MTVSPTSSRIEPSGTRQQNQSDREIGSTPFSDLRIRCECGGVRGAVRGL